MAGILVHLDRDILAGALRPRAQFLGLGDGRVLILLAEDAEERAMKLPDQIEDRLRPRRCGFGVGGRPMDEPAPAIDRRIDLVAAAGEQQGLPPARAKADGADFCRGAGKPAQMRCRRFEIADRLGVRLAEHDRHDCGHVARIGRPSGAGIEIGRHRVVADIGKAPGDVADMLNEPKGLVDHNDAGVAPGLARPGEIALDRVAAALELDRFAADTAGIGHCTRDIRHRSLR